MKRQRSLTKASLEKIPVLSKAIRLLGQDGTDKLLDMVKADKPANQIKRAMKPFIKRYVAQVIGK